MIHPTAIINRDEIKRKMNKKEQRKSQSCPAARDKLGGVVVHRPIPENLACDRFNSNHSQVRVSGNGPD